MNRKEKPVKLFGLKLKLRERNAQDVLNLQEYQLSEGANHVLAFAQAISDALEPNYRLTTKRRWLFWKKETKELFTANFVLSNLSISQVKELYSDIVELDTGHRPDFEAKPGPDDNEKKKTSADK